MTPRSDGSRGLPREELEALKLLAARGAAQAPVALTSRELGELLGVSQQAASNYLVRLAELGYVERSLAGRQQHLRLTPEGSAELRRELAELQRAVEGRARLTFRGEVASGLGEGRYYLSVPGYVRQFHANLGYTPFPGTLNVKLGPAEVAALAQVRALKGTRIEGFQDQGRTFGGALCYPSHLGRQPCHFIVPDRTHYKDVLELIAPVSLRTALHLQDGDRVEVEVNGA